MKLKKIVSVTALVLALSGTLCGCGSVKSAWIAARFGAAIKRTPITAVSGTLNGTARGKTLGMDMASALHLDFTSRSDLQGRSCSELDSTVSLLGVDIDQSFQVYGLPEGEKTAYYVHLEKPSLWAKGVSGEALNLDPSLVAMLVERASDSAVIQSVEGEKGKQYRMELSFRAGDLQEIFLNAGGKLPPRLEGMDLSQVVIPLSLEIAADSYLPEKLSLRVDGLSGEVLTALIEAAGKDMKGVELESGTLSLELNEFRFTPQAIPALPEGAEENAARMEELRDFIRKLFP